MSTKTPRERCPECGARLARGATICASCGRLATTREPERCPVCGAQYDLVQEHCPICGAERPAPANARASSFVGIALGLVALAVIVVLGVQLRPWQNATLDPDALVAAAIDRLGPTLEPETQMLLTPTTAPTVTALPLAAMLQPTTPSHPTAAPEPTLTPSAAPSVAPTNAAAYAVQDGDTLLKIATAHNLSLEALLTANGLTEDAALAVGQELQLPARQPETPSLVTAAPTVTPAAAVAPAGPLVHVVGSGDTLLAIARAYGVDSAAIARANDISESSILSVGQELAIPATGGALAPAAAPVTPTPTPEPTVGRTALPSPTPTERPAVLRHTIAKGDNLGRIALQYDVAAEEIAAANGIKTTAVLNIGQELIIPGQTAAPSATQSPTPTVTPSPTTTVRAPVAAAAQSEQAPRFKYTTPELLSPPDASAFRSAADAPLLSWVSVGILEEEEWYRLRVWTTFGKVEPRIVWTKATSWRLDNELRKGGGSEYNWQVQVATRTELGELATPLSDVSAKYTFTWR